MAAIFCALCGIPFTMYARDGWAKEFRAVYTENDQWDDVKLSGVGTFNGPQATAPLDPNSRHSDSHITPDVSIQLDLNPPNLEWMIHAGPPSDSQACWGFAFHASCWNLLHEFKPRLQQLFPACLSMPLRVRQKLDWGHDYGGVVTRTTMQSFSTLSSKSYPPATADPYEIPQISRLRLLATPLDTTVEDLNIQRLLIDIANDPFNSLPPEILDLILIDLPSKDVCSARLASRPLATLKLSETFWASRFSEGHEYHHIVEVAGSGKPGSWRTMYASMSTVKGDPGLVNRERIWGLAMQLRNLLGEIVSPCHGRPLKTCYEPTGAEDESQWWAASRGLKKFEEAFIHGSRALHSRVIEIPSNLTGLFVSFVQLESGRFISSLRFQGTDEEASIGFIHSDRESFLHIPTGATIHGWHLAFGETGIKAIAAIIDGTLSPWVGEHEGVPKMRLVENYAPCTALKADFDAFKLVALSIPAVSSRPTRLHDIALWSPEIPQKHLLLNGTADDFHQNRFSNLPTPYTTVIFGGSDGSDLSELVGIVGWVFDVYDIVGIEFIYSDASKNKSLGAIGPFPMDSREREEVMSEDFRMPLSINGAEGERISGIEVQGGRGAVFGLKIKTNFSREIIFPPENVRVDSAWTVIVPQGDIVVGLYSALGQPFQNMGLISIDA